MKHKSCVGASVFLLANPWHQIWHIALTQRSVLFRWMVTLCHNVRFNHIHGVLLHPCVAVTSNLKGDVTDKPSRRVACWVIAAVTQYQHRKLRNATHVYAQKQPVANGCELCLSLTQWLSPWFVWLSSPMLLVNTMTGPVRYVQYTYKGTRPMSPTVTLLAIQTVCDSWCPSQINKLPKQTPPQPSFTSRTATVDKNRDEGVALFATIVA